MFKAAGIDRTVTVTNPVTGLEEARNLCDIASSHLVRRTFITLLYKTVQNPELIGEMSGHSEGSRAFVRYRRIDDDLLRATIEKVK